MDGRMDGNIKEWKNGRMDDRMEGWMIEWKNR